MYFGKNEEVSFETVKFYGKKITYRLVNWDFDFVWDFLFYGVWDFDFLVDWVRFWDFNGVLCEKKKVIHKTQN